MKKITLLLLALSLSLPAFSARNEMILVAIGGRTSCGSSGPAGIGMYPNFYQVISNLKGLQPTRTVHYVVACLNGSPPPSGMGEFISSRFPGKTYSGSAMDFQNEIEAISQSAPEAPVFIAGHSYGGWTAMYLALQLKKSVPIGGLYTIDPISPRCGPSQVIFGSIECRRAPQELDNAYIQKRVGAWENYFQDQDGWIHSGQVSQAMNRHIQYRGPHTQIDADSRTWVFVKDSIFSAIL